MADVQSDGDSFDGIDDLDESALAHIDAVENNLLRTGKPSSPTPAVLSLRTTSAPQAGPSRPKSQASLSVQKRPLNTKDKIIADSTYLQSSIPTYHINGPVQASRQRIIAPVSPPPRQNLRPMRIASESNSSAQYIQRDLFGGVAQSSATGCLVLSSQLGNQLPGAKKAKRTKQWDKNSQSASGSAASPNPRPDRLPGTDSGFSDWNADSIDDWEEQLNEVQESSGHPYRIAALPPDSMKLQLDIKAAQNFIYPTNMTKRDYQFNIVQRALYDNVLVALPTGLGKTFIAAVVILNFFHWYPRGKIVFVAPTRPLVSQQQMACHGICGLPWEMACEMTGTTSKIRRGDEWEEKRIFYMTPQTLDNDLRTGDVDPKDIICLVVDEAHRATGNYAYCNIVAQIQAVNPYFRILALTATPGSTAERVQEVIDNLHISLIELRTEEALDIRQYIHRKHEETITVQMTDDFRHVRNLYLDVMQENCEVLVKHGLLPNADPSTLHPFRVRSVYAERKDILAKKRWLGAVIQETARMAEARSHLDIFSIRMFSSRLQDLIGSLKKQDAKKMKLAQVLNLAASIPDQAHPKMTVAADTILSHFQRKRQGGDDSTRVMVFCSLRECVHEIVELLNAHEGLKATPFIGQSTDKQGRGMTQKQQKDIIQKFKEGKINIIVATSIGEEGLDIGEVDLIVCYEAVKDSVRMLQRVGRTGRKRDGRIVVLMAEGPESSVWQKSKDTYKGVQNTIIAGHSVTLFDDVPRLIPPSIRPTPTFAELDQPDFQPELIGKKRSLPGRTTKAGERIKRRKEALRDPTRNVPEGALVGFLRASSLKVQKGKRQDRLQEGDDESVSSEGREELHLSDDSDDEALERGLDLSRSKDKGKPRPIQSKARETVVRRPKQRLAIEHSDESSSEDSERFPLALASPLSSSSSGLLKSSSSPPSLPTFGRHASREGEAVGRSSRQVQNGDDHHHPITIPSSQKDVDSSWTLDADNLANLTQEIIGRRAASREPSPEVYRRREAHPLVAQLAAEQALSNPRPDQLSPTDDDKESSDRGAEHSSDTDDEAALAGNDSIFKDPATAAAGGEPWQGTTQEDSPLVSRPNRRPLRHMIPTSSPLPEVTMGPPSKPAPRGNARIGLTERSSRPDAGVSSHLLENTPEDPAKQRKKRKRKLPKKRIGNSPTSKALFRFEAERDTDEERRGVRSDSDDEGANTDSADSSDLEHVGDFQPTQAPRGYNQRSIYQQSLLTQGAPTPFRRKTVGGFVGGRYGPPATPEEGEDSPHRRRPLPLPQTSSRMSDRGEEDSYSVGSFVCADDEIDWDSENGGNGDGSCSDD